MILKLRRQVFLAAVLVAASHCGVLRANGTTQRPVNGELRDVQGVPVLRVWGTASERGYAQGYLFGERIVRLLNANLKNFFDLDGGSTAYDGAAMLLMTTMRIAPEYQQEMEGIVEGAIAKFGEKATVAALGRPLAYRDLVTINCLSDMPRFGCSSFAVWGALTKDGKTLAGRNLDWHRVPGLDDEEVVVVYQPDAQRRTMGWVSITWPGFIGCLTGMNDEGVTLSVHDVYCDSPTVPVGLTPRGLLLREAIERARLDSAVENVTKVLRASTCRVGSNVAMALPIGTKPATLGPSAIFECDANKDRTAGVSRRTLKNDGKSPLHLVCTNHHRKRAEAERCGRYCKLDDTLQQMEKDGGRVDEESAWKLLQDVAQPGSEGFPILTHYSVVFEPDRKKLHVAFSRGGRAAPFCRPIGLDVAELMRPPRLAAKEPESDHGVPTGASR